MPKRRTASRVLPAPPRSILQSLTPRIQAMKQAAQLEQARNRALARVYRKGSASQRAIQAALYKLAGVTPRQLMEEQAALARKAERAIEPSKLALERAVSEAAKSRRADMKLLLANLREKSGPRN